MNQQEQNKKLALNETIQKVADETFGELAFMLIMPDFEDTADRQIVWGYGASVEFTGPFSGRLFVSITSDMLEPLAANMLGLEPGEAPPEGVKVVDALKELLNVICGNLLPAIAGHEKIFNISGPEMRDDPNPPESLSGHQLAGQDELLLDSGRACLRLFIDENVNLSELL